MRVPFFCPQCKTDTTIESGRLNQAAKKGLPIYCGRVCSGLARRKENPKTSSNRAYKAAYDRQYRASKVDLLRAKKKAYYAKTGPLRRDKEREFRRSRAAEHAEYCRTPEYREWKQGYDKKHRSKKFYGPFWEAAILLNGLDDELNSRMTWFERHQNGEINKAQQRRRDYGRITGNTGRTKADRQQPKGFSLGHPQQDSLGQHAASAG